MTMQRIRLIGALALLGSVWACKGPAGPGSNGSVSVSVATRPGGSVRAKTGALPMTSAGSDTSRLGGDTLVVTQAELVLKHIVFKTQGDSVACGDAGELGGEHKSLEAGDQERCHELEVGPLLVDLPLGGGAARQFSVAVPPGTYTGLECKVHKPGSDADDSTFVASHPDLRDVSVRVTGTFDHRPFSYISHVSARQEQEITPPVTVGSGSPLDVTLYVDLITWFVDHAGTHLVDPTTAVAGQPNESVVAWNIRRSFRAFRDEDHDGRDDH